MIAMSVSTYMKFFFIFIHWQIILGQVSLPPIQHAHVEEFLDRAQHQMDVIYNEFNKNIYDKGNRQQEGSPAWYMALSHEMKPTVYNMTQKSLIVEEATRYMAEAYSLSKEQISLALSEMDLSDTSMGRTCPMTADRPCKSAKFRAFSGYCNNVQNPRWGNANTKYSRLLPPAYEDGVSLPRGGGISSRTILPGPREISLSVHSDGQNDNEKRHEYLSVLSVVWAQFLAHDLAHTPFVSGYNGEKLKCCGVSFSEFHAECFPIKLSDVPSRSRRQRCQEFIRSASSLRVGCGFGPREQLNQATAYLDASPLYGNSKTESDTLRTFSGGKLKNQEVNKRVLMPKSQNNICRNNGNAVQCFQSGDVRANENIGIASLYTLLLREHNKIAEELQKINPHWNDETLFQETRRIVIAEVQHVTYNEFLPIVLSSNTIDKFSLKLTKNGYFRGYNMNQNPSTINSVAHAAMWFIASLIPNILKSKQNDEVLQFAETFFAPFQLYENEGYEKVLKGLVDSSTSKDDPMVDFEMINNMFKDNEYNGAGLDLAAQIIQRGRDHGLPSYTEYRKFCRLKTIKSFNDLNGITTPKIKNILQKIYKNVTDIDLFTGGLSEISMLGSVTGPTFNCLLGHQFLATKTGDRHWYENDMPPSLFSSKQLEEIRKTSLARIICENSNLDDIQPNPFLIPDFYLNEKMFCGKSFEKFDLKQWKHDASQVMDSIVLKQILSQAENDVKDLYAKENYQYSEFDSPVGTAFKFNRPKRQATVIANTSLLLQFASRRIIDNYLQSLQDRETKDVRQLVLLLPEIDLTNFLTFPQSSQCEEVDVPCDHTNLFRSVTGRCNNLENPEFGMSMRSFNRLLSPAYDDGIGSPRQTSVLGGLLPSARLISSRLHPDITSPHKKYSLMLMQMAQITDHDLTHTPVNVKHIGVGVLDCSPCKTTPSGCIPIPIPENDPFFPNRDPETDEPKCIPVTRSLPSQLTLGHREQMNQVTAYLDCSFIYGSDNCETKQLRLFTGGKLNYTLKANMKPLLPETLTNPECRSESKKCFRAGDLRASEQPGLASLHTIFLREHNRISDELAKINRHWNDEQIYQNSRRIVIAMTQHIIFSELLPRIFGWEQLETYGLDLVKRGYYTGYDKNCDATLVNEFSASAYRFGHSLLRPIFKRMNNKNVAQEPEIRLRDHFFSPSLLYHQNMVDELLTGLASTPMETLDQFVTQEVSNHLFEDKRIAFSGMDLPAINIQRGRDHGIPGYNKYREFCNLTLAQDFRDLEDHIPGPIVYEFSRIYKHVDDIDLFPGGLTEVPLKGGIIGPTIACIVGNQFRRLRMCDRFWYENDNPFTRFSLEQLEEIRKTVLSRIICDNTDNIATIQKHVLDLPDPFLNPRLSCKNFEPLNLNLWKDQNRCIIKETIIEIGNYENVTPCTICICTKEGVICESRKINNCNTLLLTHSWESVTKDDVCKVQCAHVFAVTENRLRNDTFEFT